MSGRGYAIDEAGPSSATNQRVYAHDQGRELSLFIGTFTTLLAVINPFEVMPVYLKLLEVNVQKHHQVAWQACLYRYS